MDEESLEKLEEASSGVYFPIRNRDSWKNYIETPRRFCRENCPDNTHETILDLRKKFAEVFLGEDTTKHSHVYYWHRISLTVNASNCHKCMLYQVNQAEIDLLSALNEAFGKSLATFQSYSLIKREEK